MTKAGRPRKAPSVKWTIYVPAQLAEMIDLLYLDPVHAKIRYGYRTALCVQLLREWLEERRNHPVPLSQLLHDVTESEPHNPDQNGDETGRPEAGTGGESD